MSSDSASPPPLARALLFWMLPAPDRDGAINELDEKFAVYASSAMGRRGARRWYRRQVVGALHPRFWKRPFETRDAVGSPGKGRSSVMLNVLHDVRFGLRMLAKSPGLTAVIVVTLALGLGFNGAIFSLTNTILLNELPIEEPDRVLFVDFENPSQGRESLRASYADSRDFAAVNRSFASFAVWSSTSVNLSDGVDVPQRYDSAWVEPSIFDVLRVQPQLGRRFESRDSEPGAEPVALIGHGVWVTRYGANPEILGRVVQINASPVTVVGVLPPELEQTPINPDVWTPLVPTERMQSDRGQRFLMAAGRLRPGASQADAVVEFDQIAARLAAEHVETSEGVGVIVDTYSERFTNTANKVIVLVLMGAVVFLLMIACANVANLLVSRSIERGREVMIRSALGASRWRVVRQLLVEGLLLSAIGGAGAIFLTVWGARVLERAIAAGAPPRYWDFSVAPRVFVFVLAISVVSSVVFALAPALHVTRGDVSESLKAGGRASGGKRTRRLTGFLVVAQVALSIVLLAGAGVMVRSTLNILDVDWSIDPEDVLTVRLTLPSATYPGRENIVAFHDGLVQRLATLPGVRNVVLTSSFPADFDGGFPASAELEGLAVSDGNPEVMLTRLIVSPDYFELAEVVPLRGRLFDRGDGLQDELVVLVEQRMAERFWSGQDPVGKRLRWVDAAETRWLQVIGVVPNLTQALEMDFEPVYPVVYTPFEQQPLRGMGLMIRSSADPETLAGLLREEVQRLDRNLPVASVATLDDVIGERTMPWRIVSAIFLLLGAVALFLACIGIYSVMAFAVRRRRQELSIRRALGARGIEILSLVARTSLWQMAAGVVLGLAGAFGLTRLIGIFMYEVSPTDPLTFGLVLVLLGITALLAGLIPSRRASRVDPIVALRTD